MMDFKQHCIKNWGKPDIEKTCLNLQNKHGLTVATILYAKWCDDNRFYFDSSVIEFSKDYEIAHIIPLRVMRKSIDKTNPAYDKAMQNELVAEFSMIQEIVDTYQKNAVDSGAKNNTDNQSALSILSNLTGIEITI